MLFWSIAAFPVMIGLSILVDGPAPLLFAFVPFLGGILRMTYAWMFEDGVAPPAPGLPAPYSPPPASIAGRTTGELQPPPSVTEHTTRLLDN